jgi:DNA-directed RNA polymerase specialized sigma24 family protein
MLHLEQPLQLGDVQAESMSELRADLLWRIAKNSWLDHVRKHQRCQPNNPVELAAWFGSVQPE